jgi:hypothetical protein
MFSSQAIEYFAAKSRLAVRLVLALLGSLLVLNNSAQTTNIIEFAQPVYFALENSSFAVITLVRSGPALTNVSTVQFQLCRHHSRAKWSRAYQRFHRAILDD